MIEKVARVVSGDMDGARSDVERAAALGVELAPGLVRELEAPD